ncbi:MAG: hypothetical protein WBB29_03805 [Geitlerinemataceae cyanobacterium]
MPTDPTNLPKTRIDLDSDLFLSLATTPVLLGLWGARILNDCLQDLSDVSEEIWRGDRLPVLNFPTSEEDKES